MMDLILVSIIVLSILGEFIVIYYKQKIDTIPVFSIFIPLFLISKGVTDLFLIALLCFLGIIIFTMKEFSMNFDADIELKWYNIFFKSIFTIFIFFVVWIFGVFFNKSLISFLVFFIIYSYLYLVFFVSFISHKFEQKLKKDLSAYLDGAIVDKPSINDEIKNEIFEKVFLNIIHSKTLLPYRFIFFEYYLILGCVIGFYLYLLFVNTYLDSPMNYFFNSLVLVFILYSFFVFILRFVYNVYIFNFFLDYFKNLVDSMILGYEKKLIDKEFILLKENNSKLLNWLKYLGEFYSRLDDNPDYEDLYNSFYSILSKSLNFSRFIIFMPEREDSIADSIRAVFYRGIGKTELYTKNTAVEVVVNSLKSVYYFGGTVFSALSLFKDDRSFICSPIKVGNKLIGVVYISSVNTRSFGEEDISFVDLLCDKFAIMYILYKEYSKTLNMAIRDGLTGLYTHRHFQELLSKEIENAKLYGYPVCLLMIDTDKFKQYNDAFGHPMGDELLKGISKILYNNVKDRGYVCRYGGDEFAIILPNFYKEDAYFLAEEIRKSYKSLKKGDIEVGASIGVACFPIDASSKDELIKKADELLYRAKKEGRNRVIMA
ncbi:MAG: diguanylate cyclase [bacterium]|nr:diguanylate cyclase [bacterium]